MPKIIPNSKGGKIIFDEQDWLAGLHPQYTNSYTDNQKIGNYLAYTRGMNPYRNLGYALPGFNPTDVTNVAAVTDALINGVINGTSAYAVSLGAKLHKITASTGAVANAGIWPHTIPDAGHSGHTAVVGDDVVVYPIGTANYLFYSWKDNTDWDVGTYDFNTTFNDDHMSVSAASPLASPYLTGGVGKPHPLYVSHYDGNLYIGDRNFVHKFDGQTGANGTFTAAAFTLPQGYIINSFAEVDGYLVIYSYYNSGDAGSGNYYKGKAKAFFWDYWNSKPEKIKDLNDNYVEAGFEYKGTIGCFTQGRSGDPTNGTRTVKLKLFNGSEFETVCSYIGNPPRNGGVDIQGEVIYWAQTNNVETSVWSWGSPFKGMPIGLNRLTEGSGAVAGMLKAFAGNVQLLSSGSTTTGGLQKINSDYYHQSGLATAFAEPNFPVDMFGRVTRMMVRFAKTASGGRNIKFTLYNRAGGSAGMEDDSTNLTTITSANIIKKYYPILNFEALKLAIIWGSGSAATDAPGVSSVEVDYETINF